LAASFFDLAEFAQAHGWSAEELLSGEIKAAVNTGFGNRRAEFADLRVFSKIRSVAVLGHSHVRQTTSFPKFHAFLADGSCCARGRAHSGCELSLILKTRHNLS